MLMTPIFDQLCRELRETTEPTESEVVPVSPEISVEATEIEPEAAVEPEPVPSHRPEEASIEWSAECVT